MSSKYVSLILIDSSTIVLRFNFFNVSQMNLTQSIRFEVETYELFSTRSHQIFDKYEDGYNSW